MTPKLIAGGVALVAVSAVFGMLAVLLSSARPALVSVTPQSQRAQSAAAMLERRLEKAARDASDTPRIGWAVTKATSAHNMMVVEIDAERLEEAKGIAIQIVEPSRSSGYDEILVYVRQPGRRVPEVRRIPWTPRAGYAESSFPDE